MNRWKDWYEQGVRDFSRAELDVKHGYFEWACFTAQQAAEKIIKAMGLKLGLTMWGHSLTELLSLLSAKIDVPASIKERAQALDLFYIPSRYPNGFPSGKPADYFNKSKAEEALNAARDLVRFCEGFLSQ